MITTMNKIPNRTKIVITSVLVMLLSALIVYLGEGMNLLSGVTQMLGLMGFNFGLTSLSVWFFVLKNKPIETRVSA